MNEHIDASMKSRTTAMLLAFVIPPLAFVYIGDTKKAWEMFALFLISAVLSIVGIGILIGLFFWFCCQILIHFYNYGEW